MDLIQEGNCALIEAIYSYNPSCVPTKYLNNYLNYRIKKRIEFAIDNQSGIMRRPIKVAQLTRQIKGEMDSFFIENGCEATIKEIADRLCLHTDLVEEIYCREVLPPQFLDAPIDAEGTTFCDTLIDEDNESPFSYACKQELKERVVEVLKTITPREERVLSLRFGLIDGHPKTLEEIGKEFRMSRERIRQIEAKALRKCRHPSRSKRLSPYLDD